MRPITIVCLFFSLVLLPGQGFGAPPGGAGFSGYPQPPTQSYGGGPAQVPLPGRYHLSREVRWLDILNFSVAIERT